MDRRHNEIFSIAQGGEMSIYELRQALHGHLSAVTLHNSNIVGKKKGLGKPTYFINAQSKNNTIRLNIWINSSKRPITLMRLCFGMVRIILKCILKKWDGED
jgi:hypothetical protein